MLKPLLSTMLTHHVQMDTAVYSWSSKDLCKPLPGSIWAHIKICFLNQCCLKAFRSLSMAENLHLNCITHTAWCTAPERSMGIAVLSCRLIYYCCIHETNKLNQKLSIWNSTFALLIYCLKFDLWYGVRFGLVSVCYLFFILDQQVWQVVLCDS